MSGRIAERLAERSVLLADGATGTSLFAMGLPAGEPPELWNESAPKRIAALHAGFLDAGADILLTNSFGANRFRLDMHGRGGDAFALARASAGIARAQADSAGRSVLVAGSMGPTGSILEPVGDLPFEAAVEAYAEQARGLLEGGADFLWGETISSAEEASALAAAARRVGAPYTITLSFDTAGRTMMGLTPTAFAGLANRLPNPPLAIGANCGTGASDLLATLLEFGEASLGLPLIAKANAGIPKFAGEEIVYDGTPELMARYACLARDAGARIVGGCCGTSSEHLRAMRAALDLDMPGPTPGTSEIVAATGPFTQVRMPGAAAARRPGKRSRRRAGGSVSSRESGGASGGARSA